MEKFVIEKTFITHGDTHCSYENGYLFESDSYNKAFNELKKLQHNAAYDLLENEGLLLLFVDVYGDCQVYAELDINREIIEY